MGAAMRPWLIAIILFFAGSVFVTASLAGEKEEAVMATCAATTGPTAVGYVGCVAAGLTGNEVAKCISTPSQCYGKNNEVRKFFCAVGIGGCSQPDQPAQLLRVMPFHVAVR